MGRQALKSGRGWIVDRICGFALQQSGSAGASSPLIVVLIVAPLKMSARCGVRSKTLGFILRVARCFNSWLLGLMRVMFSARRRVWWCKSGLLTVSVRNVDRYPLLDSLDYSMPLLSRTNPSGIDTYYVCTRQQRPSSLAISSTLFFLCGWSLQCSFYSSYLCTELSV